MSYTDNEEGCLGIFKGVVSVIIILAILLFFVFVTINAPRQKKDQIDACFARGGIAITNSVDTSVQCAEPTPEKK